LSELSAEQRGRVGVVRATFCGTESMPTATTRLRARVSTCEIGGPDDSLRGGKPGVAVCRFRPDGRVFAVGGWDRRVRIFDRTGEAAPLAILKGHSASVTAIDWAPNSPSTGFLATGAGDGRISIWRCFSS
jgi:WD40 repeat protein